MKYVLALVTCLLIARAIELRAETYALGDPRRERTLRVVREYNVPVRRGQPSVAAIPALMSFWGATNWQIVRRSEFEYGQKPDSVRVTSDNRGMPRRYYELTWQAPAADTILVKQILDVELLAFNKLYTRATLPYPADVANRFASSLDDDSKEGIHTDDPALQPICDEILSKTRSAEEAVELVCDWINENIDFEKIQLSSSETLAQRKGSCTPMSKLACALLRRIGIPAEVVSSKFIESDSGHSFIEVYFPDSGWVFYDLSNWNRGFKSLDCLMTVGWSYRAGPLNRTEWIEGYFSEETDTKPFEKLDRRGNRRLRDEPDGCIVAGVHVQKSGPPSSVRIRHEPLSQLIVNLDVPPGPRAYGETASAQDTGPHKATPIAIPADKSVMRTWRSRQGTSVEARLLAIQGQRILLETASGQRVGIGLSELSDDDQVYVDTVAESIGRP